MAAPIPREPPVTTTDLVANDLAALRLPLLNWRHIWLQQASFESIETTTTPHWNRRSAVASTETHSGVLQMLSTLSNIMGVCASCGISEQEKAEQERQAAAEQRRLVVQASEPVRLLSTSPEFELVAYEANTVLEVLEIRAVQIGLPKAAAVWLKLEFSGAIISHHKTVKEAGLCEQAEIR